MMNDIGRLQVGFFMDVVHKNGIQSGIHGAFDIGIKVVTNHDAVGSVGTGLLQGVIKNFFVWL